MSPGLRRRLTQTLRMGSACLCASTVLCAPFSYEATAWHQAVPPACRATGRVVSLAELPEASGIAASRRSPGIFWTHNDAGQAILFALDAQGSLKSRIRVTGVALQDWEDIAVGPCPRGSCIYVADIGDNAARRNQITVYRVPEPATTDRATATPEVFHATYPDGPQDAETLLVLADASVFIVSKGETGSIALYRFPGALRAGTTVQLERVGQALITGKASGDNRITGGAASQDGRWVVLRTHDHLTFYRTADFVAGTWREAMRVDLNEFKEPQGEGVALGADNMVYLVGEGVGKSRAGTFARFSCVLSP